MKKPQKRGRPRKDNISVHIVLEPDLHKRIDGQATRESRKFSNMLNVILRKHFDGLDANASSSS